LVCAADDVNASDPWAGLPNEMRLSCGASQKISQTDGLHTRRGAASFKRVLGRAHTTA
jgi:hypothetical protein